jgi:hypothetical protein
MVRVYLTLSDTLIQERIRVITAKRQRSSSHPAVEELKRQRTDQVTRMSICPIYQDEVAADQIHVFEW